MMKKIRKFWMYVLFGEICDCDKHNGEGEAAGCYICSKHFRLIPFLLKVFFYDS